MQTPTNLYTLAEAAELTGLSTEALRLRLKRGRLDGVPGNDGHPRVRLTTADLDVLRARAAQQKSTLSSAETHVEPTESNFLSLLEAAVEPWRERAEKAEVERAEVRALADRQAVELAVQRERAARAEGERDTERAGRGKVETERDAARSELANWTAGGPLMRAVRGLLHRRYT